MERQVTGNTGAAGEILPAAGEDLQGVRAESLLTAAKDIPDYHCTSASLRSLAGMGQVRAAM